MTHGKAARVALLLSLVCLASLGVGAGAGEHKHEHKAPHGGTLVVFGEEAAHLELVLDAKTGSLTGYVLDGEAEKAVRIKQKEIALKIVLPGEKKKEAKLALKARANVLTGEKEGDTSEFGGQTDELKDAKEFEVKLEKIEIKGKTYKDIAFNFPKGNEDHGHSHGKDEHKHDHDHKHGK